MTSEERGDNAAEPQCQADSSAAGDTSVEGTHLDATQQLTPSQQQEPAAASDPAIPETLGRYQLRRLLGRGGFGAVYEGFDPQLDRLVAIKVPLIHADAQTIADEFLNEARRLAQLRHHGIVAVHDVGVDQGFCYIVSEYLRGIDLHTWLNANKPSWQQVVSIGAAIADALAHAHAQSTIHRDIKPGNVMLIEEAGGLVPKLLDFGLAISESHAAENQRGMVTGTPAYMSPEQSRGLAHRIDGRTDIYSLGVVLYQMLCGQRPFRAKKMDELVRQIREDSPQPPRQLAHGIPSELEDICLKAMSKKEADRYKTAGDMATALRELITGAKSSSAAAPRLVASPPQVDAPLQVAEPAQAVEPEQSVEPASDSAVLATPSAVRRARDAERRQLTVMICNCDASNPEESFASLDPEDQRDLLESFHTLCQEWIERFGGTIIQSTGQEMLVCFGYPIAYEDAPHRAIRAGMGILEEMSQLNKAFRKQQKIQLAAWVAIHTGMVVAGGSGIADSDDKFSVVGDARNVISRMEALTQPEQVVISEATHQLVKDSFACESQGKHTIRGISQPIELFQVIEEGAGRSRVELVDPANLTPLVGREMELGIIKDRWEHAEEAMGQVVLLIGDAGLGKSRLVREIKEHIAKGNPDSPPRVIEWRCSAYHTGSTLFPATDFFERLLGFSRGDSPQIRLDKLVEHLHQYRLDAPEQVAIFASLLSIPPDERCAAIELSPARQKERTQALLREWVCEFASQQPVLFIVEDLHWVDPSTLEFLTLHVEQGIHDRVLTLLTFRPDFRTPWQSHGQMTQVALTRLTKRQIGELIQRKTGIENIPVEIVNQLADRTDGVPLFVEEFTRMVQESGALESDQTVKGVALALSQIPVTLHDLLAARLDRMESDPDVVQLGATFGREFSYELLQAACDLEEEELQRELAKLVEAELLFQKGHPPKCVYLFKHALIQDAAYNSLLKKKRQQFHKKIAETFENNGDQTSLTQPELLAHHYSEAGEAEKAAGYWLQAGKHAQQHSANSEAISHLTRGLQVLETLDESTQRNVTELGFQLTLAPVLMAARGWSAPEVGTAIERAQQLVSEIGSVEDQFFVMWGLWGWRLIRADIDICIGIAEDLLQLVNDSPQSSELLSEAYWVVGATAYYQGNFQPALELLEKAIPLIDNENERAYSLKTGQRCSVLCRSHAALALWQLGFPDQALQRAEQMIQLAKDQDHAFSYAMALFFRRQILEFCRLDDQVRESIEQEFKVCHEGGFVFFEVHAVFGRGVLLLREEKVDEAREQFALGLEMLSATGGHLSMDHPYRNIAEAFLLAGLLDDAQQWLDRGFDLVNNRNERGMESEFLRLQGDIALASGDEKRAEQHYGRALEVARLQRAISWELRAGISFAELRNRQGEPQAGRQLLQEIYQSFEEGLDSSDLVRAKSLLNE